jgi:hypothetical protein
MSLVPVELPGESPPAAPAAAGLIADARARIESFIESHLDRPIHAFVPSDFPLVYAALCHVAQRRLATGSLLCEWGSGAGVVACLAAMVGFDAHGIEFEADLVELARQLAGAHGVNVEFHQGNFVPHGGQEIAEAVSDFEWLAVGGNDPYEQMELEIDDFDVIFAYPWPGEHRVVERLFERFAADGALLMTYNGEDGIRLFRKRSGKGARRRGRPER